MKNVYSAVGSDVGATSDSIYFMNNIMKHYIE